MATLSDMRTSLARALRDTSNATFSTAELDDLINEGIDALGDLQPREVVIEVGTISTGVYSYALSGVSLVYRVDIHTSAGTYRATIPHGVGEGPNSGWEIHGGVLYLPPSWTLTAGDRIIAFGYAAYTQLSASTATTDLSTSGVFAVITYAQAEALERLVADRAKFQQWQADSNNTDVSLMQIGSIAAQAARRWDAQRQRMRRMRKLG
jgi:hypothetical protein